MACAVVEPLILKLDQVFILDLRDPFREACFLRKFDYLYVT